MNGGFKYQYHLLSGEGMNVFFLVIEFPVYELLLLFLTVRIDIYIFLDKGCELIEVVMLEVSRKQIPDKIRNFSHHKPDAPFVPRYHVVVAFIIHQLIRLHQKRRRYRPLPNSQHQI